MVKKTKLPKTRQGTSKAAHGNARREEIAAVIAERNQIKPPSPKVAEAISLFKSWLTDESGYDERVWPRLKKALEQERERVGARRLFDG
jgi:hypothetical protein